MTMLYTTRERVREVAHMSTVQALETLFPGALSSSSADKAFEPGDIVTRNDEPGGPLLLVIYADTPHDKSLFHGVAMTASKTDPTYGQVGVYCRRYFRKEGTLANVYFSRP